MENKVILSKIINTCIYSTLLILFFISQCGNIYRIYIYNFIEYLKIGYLEMGFVHVLELIMIQTKFLNIPPPREQLNCYIYLLTPPTNQTSFFLALYDNY